MKRKQKRLFGFFGLALVAVITVFAAALPGPETSATSTVTDTVTVRVVGSDTHASIDSPASGTTIVGPTQTITYDYENIGVVTITLEYTDENGNTQVVPLQVIDADYQAGSGQYPLNLESYGYGDYIIRIHGEDNEGIYYDDAIRLAYYPVTGIAEQNNNDEGLVDVTLNYDENNDDINNFLINVYDSEGNLIEGLSPTTVTPPNRTLQLDFGSLGLEDGLYTITITAYDANGNALHTPYALSVNYTTTPVPVPDTGGLFQNTNISSTDYLITGIIIFGLVAVAGVMFILKDNKKSNAKNRRRK